METLYFYNAGSPESGEEGHLTLNAGVLETSNDGMSMWVDSGRLRLQVLSEIAQPTDEQIFDFYRNWTNGAVFTSPLPLSPDEIKDFLG